MRLNPFQSRRGRDDDDEHVVVSRSNKHNNNNKSRNNKASRSPDPRSRRGRPNYSDSEDDEDRYRTAAAARNRSRGRSPSAGRGGPNSQQQQPRRRSATPGANTRKRLSSQRDSPGTSSPEVEIGRQNSSANPASPVRRPRAATPNGRRRAASSSPESIVRNNNNRRTIAARRNTMNGGSKASSSRRSKASRSTYSMTNSDSSSDDDDDDDDDNNNSTARRRRAARRPSASTAASRGRSKSRGRVVPGSTIRRSRSRDPAAASWDTSPESDSSPQRRSRQRGSPRNARSLSKSGPRTTTKRRGRRFSSPQPLSASSRKGKDKSSKSSGRHSWGGFLLRRGKNDNNNTSTTNSNSNSKSNSNKSNSTKGGPKRQHQRRPSSSDELAESRDPIEHHHTTDDEDYYDSPPRRRRTPQQQQQLREPRDSPAYFPPSLGPPEPLAMAMANHPSRMTMIHDEHYVDPKRREPYANLYELDNFPAVDRVPTAIGYHSDDSGEEFQMPSHRSQQRRKRRNHKDHNDDENRDDDEDDDRNKNNNHNDADETGSFTSRYSVDVKSIRSAKLKKNKHHVSNSMHRSRYRNGANPEEDDDNFSHDEHDDKYAQYLSGVNANAVMSDSSESCPPTWHPKLDLEDSDWYDEDEAAKEKMNKQRNSNKKYQVSGMISLSEQQQRNKTRQQNRARNSKKKQKEEESKSSTNEEQSKDDKDDEDERTENKGDAIVANRSEGSDGHAPRSSRAVVLEGITGDPRAGPRMEDAYAGGGGDSDDDDELTGVLRRQRRRKQQQQPRFASGGGKSRPKGYADDDEDYMDDESSFVSEDSFDDARRGRKQNRGNGKGINKGRAKLSSMMKPALAKMKSSPTKGKSLKDKLKNFRRGGRGQPMDYGSSSEDSSGDDASKGSANMPPNHQSIYSEGRKPRRADPSLAQLEEDEIKESTATHNMIRNDRKEIAELDEMDEASVQPDANLISCGVFPFLSGSSCFYNGGGVPVEEVPLDSVQIQRLRDAKHDLENKPKVEVILQDLQDPMAEKYDQLEKMQRKQQREVRQKKEAQKETEKREREELLRMKMEMRETEQRKLHQAHNKDLTMQEAPDLNRGKSQSFVMDISDWVLNLDDNGGGPRKTPLASKDKDKDKDTPRTNGRDGSSSPIEKLPFSTIEVPTATVDSAENKVPPAKGGKPQGWRRKKKRAVSNSSGPGAATTNTGKGGQKKNETKKKGWFRRG